MKLAVKKSAKILYKALLIYLAFAVRAAVFPYLIPKHVSNLPQSSSYYGDSQGPDWAVLVEEPQDAFARRVEIIRCAEDSLDVCCHNLKAGDTVEVLMGEIFKAADRGVKVRLMLDGTLGGLRGGRADLRCAVLSHPNIEYRHYNPMKLYNPWTWNVVLHDKFIIADDKMLLLGGRNMGDEYFAPPGYSKPITHDRDVLVLNAMAGTDKSSGSVTWQARDYMDMLWNAPETDAPAPVSGRKYEKGINEQQRVKALSEKWEKDYPDYYLPPQPVEEICIPTRKISLVYNPLSPFKSEPYVGAAIGQLLCDSEDVHIQTPYATANKFTLKTLAKIASDTSLRIQTNSLASSPNFPAFSNYLSQRQKFINTGAELYEYQSKDSIHGKSCTAGGNISVVGSFNLDDRSLYIDTESVLVIDSPEFYKELEGKLNKLQDKSALVGEDNSYLPGQDVEILDVSFGKKALMYTVSLLSRLLQFLI